MKKRFVSYRGVLSLAIIFSSYSAAIGQEGMTNLTGNFPIADSYIQEWMPGIEYNSIDNEFMVMWHASGVREEGGENIYSFHGQRVAADGTLIGDQFSPFIASGPETKILPTPAYNPFTNQYMVAASIAQPASGLDVFVTIVNNVGNSILEPFPLSENPASDLHASIAFNSVNREYFVTYNSNRTTDGGDIFGVILDEDGTIIKSEFIINSSAGPQINPFACYNPHDNTYLVNWEDFRHVISWEEPASIYGALLDNEGSVTVNDIPMFDDYNTPGEGDQRHNNIAYNSDKNEFLASWTDMRPALNNVAAVGRIIKADGSLGGAEFIISDAPGAQIFPHVVYVPEKKLYFAIWEDNRNDADTSIFWRDSKNLDIYAKWLKPNGEAASDDISVCSKEGVQRYSKVVYNPLMDRFLIVWQDIVQEGAEWGPGGEQHIKEAGGNIIGDVYGTPSFLCTRVVEKGSGSGIEGAQVTVLGMTYVKRETTSTGGWFNIKKDAQKNGKYFLISRMKGYRTAVKSVDYTGEPLEITVEMTN